MCFTMYFLWLFACALLGIGNTPMGVLLAITAHHCPQSMNGPHHTTTQAPGKHTSHDIIFKNLRILLAIFILRELSLRKVHVNLLKLYVSDTSLGFGMMFCCFPEWCQVKVIWSPTVPRSQARYVYKSCKNSQLSLWSINARIWQKVWDMELAGSLNWSTGRKTHPTTTLSTTNPTWTGIWVWRPHCWFSSTGFMVEGVLPSLNNNM